MYGKYTSTGNICGAVAENQIDVLTVKPLTGAASL